MAESGVGVANDLPQLRVGAEVCNGVGQLDEMIDLEPPVRCEGEDRDHPEHLEREIQVEEFRGVREVHDHAVVAAQPDVVQARSEGRPAFGELPVRDGLVSVVERHAFRVLDEQPVEYVVDGTVLPVPGGAVARCEFGGKRDNAVERWHQGATSSR